MLICNLGVSTSFVKDRIVEAFTDRGKDINLIAHPRSDLEQLIEDVDIVLIAPQLGYLKDEIVQVCNDHSKKCLVIPFSLYGNMDGKAIADLIEETIKSK